MLTLLLVCEALQEEIVSSVRRLQQRGFDPTLSGFLY